jgi:hypothetical protein
LNRRRLAPLALAAGLFAAGVPFAATARAAAVKLLVEAPRSGEAVHNKVHLAPIRGNAVAEGERPASYDVMIAIDVSQSTKMASGSDVDRDGQIGLNPHMELIPPGTFPEDVLSTDPDDSILGAEVAAANALLDGLDPKRVRVGLLSFAGEVSPETGERARIDQQDAWLEVPLSTDFGAVRRALVAILARGPRGATNYAAGIRLGVRELAGLSGAESQPGPDAKKVILFLTDGVPTFPIGKGAVVDKGDVEAALNAARLAHKAQITINTYALGPGALTYPLAVTEMARLTLGTYTPVQNPGDIIALLQGVSFANIEDVVFTNLSTGDFSTDVRLSPDGSFSGFVPVREGQNRVRVTALASDGSRGSVELDLTFKLSSLSDRELAQELERIRARNRDLRLLLERKRIDDFRKQQRREIIIGPGAPEPEARPEPEPES